MDYNTRTNPNTWTCERVDVFQFRFEQFKHQPGVGGVYRRLSGRPAWVWGTALLVGLLPFALFIAALAVAAMLTTAVIFTILAAVHDLFKMIGGGIPRNDGRENVTVKYDS